MLSIARKIPRQAGGFSRVRGSRLVSEVGASLVYHCLAFVGLVAYKAVGLVAYGELDLAAGARDGRRGIEFHVFSVQADLLDLVRIVSGREGRKLDGVAVRELHPVGRGNPVNFPGSSPDRVDVYRLPWGVVALDQSLLGVAGLYGSGNLVDSSARAGRTDTVLVVRRGILEVVGLEAEHFVVSLAGGVRGRGNGSDSDPRDVSAGQLVIGAAHEIDG